MNVNLFLKSLKEIRVSWPSYAVGLILYIYLLLSIYPTIQEQFEEFERLFEQYPESVLELFAGGGTTSLTTVEGFLALEIFALIWFVIIGAFAISYGTGAIGKELDSGTIEILLSQPVSRARTLISKGIILFGATAGLVLITMASTYVFGVIYDVPLKTEGLVALTVVGTLFFLAIASYSLFFSVAFGERGRAALVSAGLLTAMYLLTSLGQNAEWAKKLDVISLFHYYDAAELLSTGEIPLESVAIYLGVTVIALVASLLVFNRRDIAP